MAMLPVVERELRVASRRPLTYWGRVVAGLVAMGLFGWVMLMEEYGRFFFGAAVGPQVFSTLFGVATFLALFSGTALTADAVASEKRDGTLGLLFLTDLKGWHIAFGKLAATSVSAFYWMLALFPVLSLTWLMGGTTVETFLRSLVVLIFTLSFSLSIGLAVSTYNRESSFAVGRAQLVMVLLAFGPKFLVYAIAVGIKQLGQSEESMTQFIETFDWASPYDAWARTSSSSGTWKFWSALGYTGFVATLAMTVAIRHLPYAWQDRPASTRKVPKPAKASTSVRETMRRAWLDQCPLGWRFLRRWFRRDLIFSLLALWGIIGVIFLLIAVKNWADSFDEIFWPLYLVSSVAGHLFLKAWFSNEAVRPWLEDRRSGAMEWLLVAPLSTREFLSSAWTALRHRFRIPFLMVVGFDFLGIIFLLPELEQTDTKFSNRLVGFFLAREFFLFLDLLAIGWLGLWLGASSRGRRPHSVAFSRVVVWPMILGVLASPVIGSSLGPVFLDNFSDIHGYILVILYFLGWDTLWLGFARGRLLSRFREAAIQPPGPAGGWFGRRKTSKA